MEFSDLNDEIIADDWLIADEEIANKRLIKQTPRFNVYKADWFGNVLVYEPISTQERRLRRQQNRRLLSRRHNLATSSESMSFQVLNKRLNSLDLSALSPLRKTIDDSQLSPSIMSTASNDSAYSSISSTPQYSTKASGPGFEFPNQSVSCPSPIICNTEGTMPTTNKKDEQTVGSGLESNHESDLRGNFRKQTERVVVLNKDSFKFSNDCLDEDESSDCKPQSSWLELNELRLVAHESFMLFMGASVNKFNFTTMSSDDTKSLVMQMNHPKAVSLHDLLHLNSGTNSLMSDRLFNFRQSRLSQQLDNLSKLNICKQIANAMDYLHDKNIVHGKLTSINIYLEQNHRVKISLIDDDQEFLASPLIDDDHKSCNSMEFNLRSLTYLSPELIRTIEFVKAIRSNNCDKLHEHQIWIDTEQLSKKSDVFSFGTLLFEIFEERSPFFPSDGPRISSIDNTCFPSANGLIYQIGSGRIGAKNLSKQDELNNGRNVTVQSVIERCWSTDPISRPSFKDLIFMFNTISL